MELFDTILSIINSEYLSNLSGPEILWRLKNKYFFLVSELDDEEIKREIARAFKATDLLYLSFKKNIHQDYFFDWFKNNKIDRKDLKKIFEKADTQGIDSERLIKDIYVEVLIYKKFISENNSAFPAIQDKDSLISTNWVIPKVSASIDLNEDIKGNHRVENLVVTSELYNILKEEISTEFSKNKILSGKQLVTIFDRIETISKHSEINIKVVHDLLKDYRFSNYPEIESENFLITKELIVSVNWYKLNGEESFYAFNNSKLNNKKMIGAKKDDNIENSLQF